MPLACQINSVRALPAVGVVALTGSIDPLSLSTLQETVRNANAKGFRTLVLNLDGVRYINSAGLSYLVQLADQLRARGAELLLANPQPKVKIVFDLMGISQFFKLHRSVGDALVAVSDHGRKKLRKQA